MNAIFCADHNWGIGKNGGLLFRLPKDMAFFKEMTTGKVVIMGRKTLESLPGGRPLKDRVNIVLSRSGSREDAEEKGYILCRDFTELEEAVREYRCDDIFVIGGASVYRALLPYCRKAYVTKVDADGGADVFVPDLTKEPYWVNLPEELNREKDNGYDIEFMTYCNLHPMMLWRPHFAELDCYDYGEVKKETVNLSHVVRIHEDDEGEAVVVLDIPDEKEGTPYTTLLVKGSYEGVIEMIELEIEREEDHFEKM